MRIFIGQLPLVSDVLYNDLKANSFIQRQTEKNESCEFPSTAFQLNVLNRNVKLDTAQAAREKKRVMYKVKRERGRGRGRKGKRKRNVSVR